MNKNIDLEGIEKQSEQKIEELKTSAGTIRRTVALIVQGVLSIGGVAWGQDILVNEGVISNIVGVASIVGIVAFIGIQFWAAWKNNSFTNKAKVADMELKASREGIASIALEHVDLDEGVKTISNDEVK